VKNFS